MELTILLPIIILQVILTIYCLYYLFTSEVKYLPKAVWGILCLCTVGCIAFLIFGKGERL